MADIYTRLQGTTRRLLRPAAQGGLGQGEIVLTRKTPGTPGPNPWDPVEPVTQAETLRGAVRGVSQRLVGTEMGGTVILASDRQAICEVPQMQYQAGDTLSVDGTPVHIIAFERIPAAGIAAAVKFTIRG
ncbi:hypothetical protein [Delftia acidovorans]|uniref:hypothetical protein n=1 Tax=Delftia acidovorans TaxID=80866 RepID=UPI002FDE1D18